VSGFLAGAHVDVQTPGGRLRPYSLCGTPGERCGVYRIAVLRERHGRGGSNDLHDHARVGTRLRLHPPRNAFPLVLPAVHTLLLGGGIGVTPLLPMAVAARHAVRAAPCGAQRRPCRVPR
jgi:vanillate monooxygenase ferredoxin subunit